MIINLPIITVKQFSITESEANLVVQLFKLSEITRSNKAKVTAIKFVGESHNIGFQDAKALCDLIINSPKNDLI